MRSILLFLMASWGCLWLMPAGYANEAMTPSIQNQIGALQNSVASMESMIRDLRITVENQNEVIRKQNVRINGLEGKPGASAPPAADPVKVVGLSQGFNPDIGVVATVQAYLTENSEDAEGQDTIALKEVEVGFSQYVDPYSRLDVILAFNDAFEEHNVEIEEGYYTHWGLPLGFVGRIGKFRSLVGKQNVLHTHQLDTVDYPFVIQDFLGEHGMHSSGVRLQNHIPNPWDIPIEVTGEIFRGNNGNSFSGFSRRPIFNTHVKSFFYVNDDMFLELGATGMFGTSNANGSDRGSSSYNVKVLGFDSTLQWLLPEGRTVKWQSELFLQDRGNPEDRAVTDFANHDPWGFYSLIDFRISAQFSAGVRFDYLEPLEVEGGHGRTTVISPYFTFWQSEFASFRVQYRHLDPADPAQKTDDAVFLQANVAIGAHSHPVS